MALTNASSPLVDSEPSVLTVRGLYEKHASSLHRALRRLAAPGVQADDLLQDVFLVALRRSSALLTAESPRAWLYGVAVKVASDSRRRKRLLRFLRLESAPPLIAPGGPLIEVEQRETARRVHAALETLSSPKREVLVLFELEGLSGNEIALAVGCPLKTVWTRLYHARRELETAMRGDE